MSGSAKCPGEFCWVFYFGTFAVIVLFSFCVLLFSSCVPPLQCTAFVLNVPISLFNFVFVFSVEPVYGPMAIWP